MNQKKPIELREYQKKSVDEHEALMLEGDLDLQNKLADKQILTILLTTTKKHNLKRIVKLELHGSLILL